MSFERADASCRACYGLAKVLATERQQQPSKAMKGVYEEKNVRNPGFYDRHMRTMEALERVEQSIDYLLANWPNLPKRKKGFPTAKELMERRLTVEEALKVCAGCNYAKPAVAGYLSEHGGKVDKK